MNPAATPAIRAPLHRLRQGFTWSGIGAAWLLTRLPVGWQLALGRGLGRLAWHLARRRRHIGEVNLRLCFPDLSATERRRLLRAHFRALGMGVVETAMSWWLPGRRLRPLVTLEGLEHLEAALARGRGVILLSAHFTTLEIAGRLLALQAPFHVMYRSHKNPVFEAVMRRARERHFDRAIRRDDLRGFLRSLRQGMPVWYAPDQNYGREHSIFVDFFGVPAATITATHRLARLSGAPVVPFFPQRLGEDPRYRLRLLPALEGFPGDDEVADTRRINALIEEAVRACPEQYLWVHRRFKTRPPGAAPVY